jgi:hypothetical protein
MTASVDATGCSGARFSVAKRLRQYKSAFKFYLHVVERCRNIKWLCFCENTGWDLSEFKQMVPADLSDRVRVVSLPLDGFDGWYGKSYNEMLLIDKALRLPSALGDFEGMCVKVTGRYPIYNIGHLIDDVVAKYSANAALNSVCLPAVQFWSVHREVCVYLDTRCLAFTASFWRDRIEGAYVKGEKKFFGEIMMDYLSMGVTECFERPFLILGEQGGWRRIGGLTLPSFFDPPILLVSYVVRKVLMLFKKTELKLKSEKTKT